MKKPLLFSLLFSACAAFAQLPNGSPAPDFTVTDLNGNTHTLSEYLAEGKTVILDISATWCGPCWAYKNTHKLADLHNSYGQNGSDEVVVLFVEGDPTTTIADLYGTGSNTQGDWTDGSPYAIIDAASVANLYDISYFPTIFRICPEGTVTEISTSLSLTGLRNNINNNCGAMTGAQNHAGLEAESVRMCETNGSFSTKMRNYGTNSITSATVTLKENGTDVASVPYSGSLAAYGSATIDFPDTTFNPGSAYSVALTAVNTQAAYNPAFCSVPMDLSFAAPTLLTEVEVVVHTDNYPSEISWSLLNSSGIEVATGGPYQPGTADQWGGGGPDANTSISQSVSLDMNECYSFMLYDSFSDGWIYGSTQHGIEVLADGESIFVHDVGNFGSSLDVTAAFKTVEAMGVDTDAKRAFSVYPNPSNGLFTLDTQETVSVSVTDLTGKVVYNATGLGNGATLNMTSLSRGVYLARIQGAHAEKVEKLVIQ